MRCPTLAELPPPPIGKTGWPWTEESRAFPATQPSGAAWPKISICMPSYNQGDYIEQTIRSILLQNYPDLELIILDGGSKDASVPIIQKYSQWISYWISEKDAGCTDATTRGLNRATGDLLAFMCADDFYALNGFSVLMKLRAAHPSAVIWVGSAHEVDLSDKLVSIQKPVIPPMGNFSNWGAETHFSTVASVFDAKTYRAIGGMDASYHLCNDVELFYRMTKLGPIVSTDEWVANVHVNPQSISRRNEGSLAAAAIVTMNYRHENYDIASKAIVDFSDSRLRWMPLADLLKIRPAEEIISVLDFKVLLRALWNRVVCAVKRRLP